MSIKIWGQKVLELLQGDGCFDPSNQEYIFKKIAKGSWHISNHFYICMLYIMLFQRFFSHPKGDAGWNFPVAEEKMYYLRVIHRATAPTVQNKKHKNASFATRESMM